MRHTKAFEADPLIEFDHFLAEKLGMSVARMQAEVSAAEHLSWQIYYGRQAQRTELSRR
jgi:hypothetical protein